MSDTPGMPSTLAAHGARVLGPDGLVELAVLERSGLIESRHLGAAVVLDPDGRVIERHGDADALIYPRSSLKPLQAEAVLASGVDLDDEELVLAAASHTGTDRHVAVVERMLAAAGLDESALQCPPDLPGDREARRTADGPRRITMNCSGKHASFLAAAVARGWSTDDYLDPRHPLQRDIVAVIEELGEERIVHSGVDGCGAPVHAMSLRALARGFSRVVTSGGRLAPAIRSHAWALEGPGGANTVTIDETGVVAKLGAEGVLAAAAPDGTTVAVKAIDGSGRATTLVGLGLLARFGAIEAEAAARVIDLTVPKVLGGGAVVGAFRLAV